MLLAYLLPSAPGLYFRLNRKDVYNMIKKENIPMVKQSRYWSVLRMDDTSTEEVITGQPRFITAVSLLRMRQPDGFYEVNLEINGEIDLSIPIQKHDGLLEILTENLDTKKEC